MGMAPDSVEAYILDRVLAARVQEHALEDGYEDEVSPTATAPPLGSSRDRDAFSQVPRGLRGL